MTTTIHQLRRRLLLHQSVFDNLVDRAEGALARDRFESAAGLVAMACDLASRHHIGRYSDDRVERLLAELGRHVADVSAGGDVTTDGESIEVDLDADVVHVVGETTRRAVEETVARWTLYGVGRSGVVSTGRDDVPLLRRAAALRRQLADADLVVLHTEPHDVVPMLAMAGERPRTVLVNHHDSVFWPGVGVADLVVSHHAVGSAIAVDRRCIPPGRTMLLPPLTAEADMWRRLLAVVDERVREVTPALPLPPLLPRVFDDQDAVLVRAQASSDRADGALGAYRRHGRNIDPLDLPAVSMVVVGLDADRTIDCLHQVLDTWSGGPVQLVVVDGSGGEELASVFDELVGTVRCVQPIGAEPVDSVTAGLAWAWGPFVAVLDDDVALADSSWNLAMADLDMEIDRLTAPVVGSDGRSSGILARTDGGEPIEQVFALVSHDVGATADSLASPDARRSPVLELTGDDHRSV